MDISLRISIQVWYIQCDMSMFYFKLFTSFSVEFSKLDFLPEIIEGSGGSKSLLFGDKRPLSEAITILL